MVAEFLNIFITHCLDVQGILVAEHTFLISQLADDTCLFLKDEKQVPVILDALNLFSNASGLSGNRNKSEIMPVHSLDIDQIEGIEVKNSVRYLGILISKSPTDRIVDNFSQRIQKSKNIFNCWLQRNLTIYGRVLISKRKVFLGLFTQLYLYMLTKKPVHLLTPCYLNFVEKQN